MAHGAAKPVMTIKGLFREQKLEPATLTERFTPAADLFVLAHLGIPAVESEGWSLTIDGLVDTPLELNFDELLRRPKRIVETVHQCAGSPLEPTVPTRRIANVRWAGVDLAELLEEIGVQAAATHIWAYGLDHGEFAGAQQDFYLKDVPLSRLDEGDVLVAYELNDEPLSDKHGFPARLVVPGFFGTNSVKWLSRLQLSDSRAKSIFTTRFYNDPLPDSEATKPVWQIVPECVIVAPAPDSALPVGDHEIWGWAWSGCEVQTVDVSTDGGVTWLETQLEPQSHRSWQRFSYMWPAHQSGTFEVRCRATDTQGVTQPPDGARNAVYAITVSVGE